MLPEDKHLRGILIVYKLSDNWSYWKSRTTLPRHNDTVMTVGEIIFGIRDEWLEISNELTILAIWYLACNADESKSKELEYKKEKKNVSV